MTTNEIPMQPTKYQRNQRKTNLNLKTKNPKHNNNDNNVIPITINGDLLTCENTQPDKK